MFLQFGSVILCQKKIGKKAACKCWCNCLQDDYFDFDLESTAPPSGGRRKPTTGNRKNKKSAKSFPTRCQINISNILRAAFCTKELLHFQSLFSWCDLSHMAVFIIFIFLPSSANFCVEAKIRIHIQGSLLKSLRFTCQKDMLQKRNWSCLLKKKFFFYILSLQYIFFSFMKIDGSAGYYFASL